MTKNNPNIKFNISSELKDDECNAFKLLTIALAVFLFFIQIYHSFNFPVWRDDAFFGSIAKNLAAGQGYKAIFFDGDYPFHSSISTGPMLILPTALMILIFGNSYLVTSIAPVLLIWILLVLIFIKVSNLLGKERRWLFSFLALSLTLLFSIQDYGVGFETRDVVGLWHLLMGDVSAAFFIVLATLLLFSPKFIKKTIMLGGMVLGLAVMDKTISAIAALVILSAFSATILFKKDLKNSEKIILVALAGFSAIAPLFLFEIVKIIVLGWQNYWQIHSKKKFWFNEKQ